MMNNDNNEQLNVLKLMLFVSGHIMHLEIRLKLVAYKEVVHIEI